MRIAFSPCPNDTFVFHALVHGLVPGAPPIDPVTEVTHADIDVTNAATERGEFDVAKISYAALPAALERYALLPCGGAVGRGCGPLVLAADDRPADSLAGATVAVPSLRSTAYLLFSRWSADFAPGKVVVLPFDRIMPAVVSGQVDAGLVIHEARFTYQRYGLTSIADLGTWWENDTGLPIPLGAIVARRDLDQHSLAGWIRESVRLAWADPSRSRAYVLSHAQEMDPAVVDQHIALYVNGFTDDLGETGLSAVEALLGIGRDRLLAE